MSHSLSKSSLSRRTFLLGSAGVLGLSACGSSTDQASSGGKTELVYRLWDEQQEVGSAAHLQAALEARGLELLADPDHRLAPLTAVRVPEGVDGKAVQGRMLRDHGIEIGGGLGPDAPAMWRIGLMGRNARVETADRVLAAFDAVLAEEPAAVATA